MTRFFVHPQQIHDDRVTLSDSDVHHLRVVLQARLGDKIAVLDSSGREWPGTLETLTKTWAEARLNQPVVLQTEPKTQITVAQALPKIADKMEQVLQRGTEVGVSAFISFQSERSLSHLTGERQVKRLSRWQEIIKTAAEQSHRAVLPALSIGVNWNTLLSSFAAYQEVLLLHPGVSHRSLKAALKEAPKTLLVIVGPESGFTELEVKGALDSGAQSITLGPRILRTETAALVAVSQILYALEPDNVC